ncbi:hypothetical protein [Streptococcus suis]|uniref:hypothetical protein n=1 Tax=Streptococcus suis TaxID=1307 RepID=UPI0007693BC7|nr:hypothetical protein [Streptococcus suis]MDW8657424.1 hypothetical protein [Streptococcus suis]MDW8663243.1 hypothetical protein [Streptococcus suis]MDW8697275.1 hypothetical protein [Streptococcus suis]MDW8727914.1 hypothetical protein [Streptococcus suis]NQF64738.1 hypothetical protein [Streptococcus suis]
MKKLIKYLFTVENISSIGLIIFFSFLYLSVPQVENPAINTLKSIDGTKVLFVMFVSFSLSGVSAFFIVDFLKYILKNDDDIHFDIVYILFTVLLGIGLLSVLTEEQFSLISTFIAFPLFITFPKILKKIVKKRSIKRENDK